MHERLPDRSEERPGNRSQAAASDDNQLRRRRGANERVLRRGLDAVQVHCDIGEPGSGGRDPLLEPVERWTVMAGIRATAVRIEMDCCQWKSERVGEPERSVDRPGAGLRIVDAHHHGRPPARGSGVRSPDDNRAVRLRNDTG